MDNQRLDLLRRHHKTLLSTILNIEEIVTLLYDKGLFPKSFINQATPDEEEKKRLVLLQLAKCNNAVFEQFVIALRRTRQEKEAQLLDPDQQFTFHAMPFDGTYGSGRAISFPDMELDVKCCAKFMDDTHLGHLPVYRCRSVKRGFVLIANSHNYSQMPERKGSIQDVKNLQTLFKKLQFEFEYLLDYKAHELDQSVKRIFQDRAYKKYDMIFVVILGHGNKDAQGTHVVGIDNKVVYTVDLENYASNGFARNLIGIPKVFLYNICRGDIVDKGVNIKVDSYTDSGHVFRTVHSVSDVIVGNATLEGYRAHRDKDEGTWYISEIVNVFAEHACRYHVEDLLKIVNYGVRLRRSAEMTMQTCTYTNKGCRAIYLNPGIYEDENGLLKYFDEPQEIMDGGEKGDGEGSEFDKIDAELGDDVDSKRNDDGIHEYKEKCCKDL